MVQVEGIKEEDDVGMMNDDGGAESDATFADTAATIITDDVTEVGGGDGGKGKRKRKRKTVYSRRPKLSHPAASTPVMSSSSSPSLQQTPAEKRGEGRTSSSSSSSSTTSSSSRKKIEGGEGVSRRSMRKVGQQSSSDPSLFLVLDEARADTGKTWAKTEIAWVQFGE